MRSAPTRGEPHGSAVRPLRRGPCLRIDKDGQVNLLSLMLPGEEPKAEPPGAAQSNAAAAPRHAQPELRNGRPPSSLSFAFKGSSLNPEHAVAGSISPERDGGPLCLLPRGIRDLLDRIRHVPGAARPAGKDAPAVGYCETVPGTGARHYGAAPANSAA